MKICEVRVDNTNDMKALFSIFLLGAVHYLIQHPIFMDTADMVPMHGLKVSALVCGPECGRERVFVHEDE